MMRIRSCLGLDVLRSEISFCCVPRHDMNNFTVREIILVSILYTEIEVI